MDYALNNCSLVTLKSPELYFIFKGKFTVYDDSKEEIIEDYSVKVKGEDVFNYRRGALIQDAFPYLSPKQREFLKTGTWFEYKEENNGI